MRHSRNYYLKLSLKPLLNHQNYSLIFTFWRKKIILVLGEGGGGTLLAGYHPFGALHPLLNLTSENNYSYKKLRLWTSWAEKQSVFALDACWFLCWFGGYFFILYADEGICSFFPYGTVSLHTLRNWNVMTHLQYRNYTCMYKYHLINMSLLLVLDRIATYREWIRLGWWYCCRFWVLERWRAKWWTWILCWGKN